MRSALTAALVLGAAFIGFKAYRLLTHPDAVATTTLPKVINAHPAVLQAPPAASAAQSEAAPGEQPAPKARGLPATRPEFSLKDRAGKLRSINEWDGKSLVLNFWATWCAPCRREIPMLSALNKARAAENVAVIGIAVDFRDQVVAYADKIGLDYDLLIGEQDGLDVLGQFGVDAVGFPFTVFTDNQGRVVTAHVGELHEDEARVILDSVAAINTGKASLEQAQKRIESGLEELDRKAAEEKPKASAS